ncbi:hypothetical protein DSL72_005914 [Monilinia vaccinii-corymbosi]|uniref:Uncharacterized protein n=1 Tax=Monilinia vaccinii-corymbosi TaxID=61207 RepID=A0A8A3PH07_9HELO|nr:hypothetical protein DSL72_005914 [Monilinia vaccinii-corymbosi]
MSSNSESSHRQAREGSISSIGTNSDHQSSHSNSSHTQSRRYLITQREGTRHSSRELHTRPHSQTSISDHQTQSESFASNRASFGGSSHDASYTSENESTGLEAQSYEITSQLSFSHLDPFSYDGLGLSHYENHLTIEEDPKDQSFNDQPDVQYVETVPATENDIQISNNELYVLQTCSPAIEMWTLEESRDERIRLGLPSGQETSMASFGCIITGETWDND